MNPPGTIGDLLALYDAKGHEHYGEGVDQMTHALQCATLARRDGATDELVIAALLHDVGHLVADVAGDERIDMRAHDDVHEAIGARVLAPLFGPRVAQPVSLHVTAKRWRCTRDPDYYERLSPTSQDTLVAQGGLLDEEACRRFEEHPGFADALALREWDDAGKSLDMVTVSWPEMTALVTAYALTR